MALELELRSLIVCLLGAALLAGCDRQSPAPVQANGTADTTGTGTGVSLDELQGDTGGADVAPPAAGMVKPDFSHKGAVAPAVTFLDPAGGKVTIASFKGKPVLVNLWATWCAPCVAELPTLDTLQKREGGKLMVLTVNQDTDANKAAPFLGRRRVALPAYTDDQLGLSVAYAANLPTTVMYGADGRERWRVTGGMDWAGPEAVKLIALGN